MLGIQPKQPLRQARALCPEAQFVPAAPSRYRAALELLMERLSHFSEHIEVDDDFQREVTLYLDLGRLKAVEALTLAENIWQTIRKSSLPASAWPSRSSPPTLPLRKPSPFN